MPEPVCGFRGCTTCTPGEYPWQMCADCFDWALEVEDSGMEMFDLYDVAAELGVDPDA